MFLMSAFEAELWPASGSPTGIACHLRLHRLPTARKRLAVPYRAGDTPSERSEYAQPDTALALTTLAYYGDGLSRGEMEEALAALLRMGPSAQRAFFDTWLHSAQGSIPLGGWLCGPVLGLKPCAM